MKKKERK